MKQNVYNYALITTFFLFSDVICAPNQLTSEQRALWAQPVAMNRVGVSSYFSHVFNEKGYGSYCIEHAVDFLGHVTTVAQPLIYVSRILDLFHIRVKEAEWSNPYAVLELLKALELQVAPLCYDVQHERVDAVKQTLYRALLARFDDLKHNPEAFLQELSNKIVQAVDATPLQQMQGKMALLIESILDKLVFSAYEQGDAWRVTKELALALERLHQKNLITDEALLQSCYWSLLFRFINCIDLTGEYFSPLTYHIMKQDLVEQASPLFRPVALPEQEVMRSRVEWFKEAVVAGEVRARLARMKRES